jgi:hypothetical protein
MAHIANELRVSGNARVEGGTMEAANVKLEPGGSFRQTDGNVNITGRVTLVGAAPSFKVEGGELSFQEFSGSTEYLDILGGTVRYKGTLWERGGARILHGEMRMEEQPKAINDAHFENSALVTIDANVNSTQSTFDNNGTVSLNNGSSISGTGAFNNNNTLVIPQGNAVILMPFYRGGVIDTVAGSTLTLAGVTSLDQPNGGLSKYGTGILKITGPISGAANTSLHVNEGLVEVHTPISGGIGVGAFYGGGLLFKSSQTLNGVGARNGGVVTMEAGGSNGLTTPWVALHNPSEAPTGTLDINDNWLHLDTYGGDMIDYLWAGQEWGTGIVSTIGGSSDRVQV